MSASKTKSIILWIGSMIAVSGLTATLVLVGLSKPQSSTLEATVPARVEAKIEGPESKAFQVAIETNRITQYVAGRMVVYVPAGAFDTEGTIMVVNREPDLFPEAGLKKWRRPITINIQFTDRDGKLIPGYQFAKPLQVCAELSDEGWENYTKIRNNFQIQVYTEDGSVPKWEELYPSYYSDKRQICGRTMHLSLFALAVWGELPPVNTPTPRVYVR
jgi:hypothetical protein